MNRRACTRIPCERTEFRKLHYRSSGAANDGVDRRGRNSLCPICAKPSCQRGSSDALYASHVG